jgi:branched-chain amino acid transport system permease protein
LDQRELKGFRMQLQNEATNVDYNRELKVLRTDLQRWMVIILLISLFVFPICPFVNDYWVRSIVNFSITIIAVIGLNILTGLCGQGSIAQAGFMAVGAYSSVILTGKLSFPFWIALPCAAVIAGLLGTLFGLSALKIKGLYLFLVTIGAHFIIEYAIMHLPSLTGGPTGLSVIPPKFAGFVFKSLRSYYYIVLCMLIVSIIVANNLVRTYIGRAWLGIRDKEIIVRGMGVDIYRYKLLAFWVGCSFAGIAGSLWAHSKTWLAPDDFSLMQACWFIGMITVGGRGTILGSILGPIFLLGLGEITIYAGPAVGRVFPSLSMGIFAASAQLFYAVVIILFLVFEPGGMVRMCQRLTFQLQKRIP